MLKLLIVFPLLRKCYPVIPACNTIVYFSLELDVATMSCTVIMMGVTIMFMLRFFHSCVAASTDHIYVTVAT